MIPIVLLLIAAVLGLLILIIALRPAEFRIARSTTVSASPSDVFAQVNNLRRWESWSPWAKLDPAMRQTYEGPTTGPGSLYAWSGNREVGEGRMTITESQPAQRLQIRLEFLKPFKATNEVEFTFQPTDAGTVVSWIMTGRNNFAAKAAHLVMNIDRKVGADFEKGLAQLKSVSESAARG